MNIDFSPSSDCLSLFAADTHFDAKKNKSFSFSFYLWSRQASSFQLPLWIALIAKFEPAQEKKKTVRQTFNGPISLELSFQSTHTTDMQYLHVHLDGHVIRMETKVNSTRIVGMQLVT